MLTVNYYLDRRRAKRNGLFPLRFVFRKNTTVAYYSTGIEIAESQWRRGEIVNHPNSMILNCFLSEKKNELQKAIYEHTLRGDFVCKSARDCVDILLSIIDKDAAEQRDKAERAHSSAKNNFSLFFLSYANTKKENTRNLYLATFSKLKCYCDSISVDITKLTFESVDVDWLNGFISFCAKTQQINTQSRHLRDIRAVFNAAREQGLTNAYPFGKNKIIILVAETKDKSYDSKELKRLFSVKNLSPKEQEAVDIFKLMVMLVGINPVDLVELKEVTKGRINYYRTKTVNSRIQRLVSIKIEPEAMRIINKYKGDHYLLNIKERYPKYKTYFNIYGKLLKTIGHDLATRKDQKGQGMFPDISWGSARTSWSTICQEELDAGRDLINAALGHQINDVTSTYLRTKWQRKIDDYNRKLINLIDI